MYKEVADPRAQVAMESIFRGSSLLLSSFLGSSPLLGILALCVLTYLSQVSKMEKDNVVVLKYETVVFDEHNLWINL